MESIRPRTSGAPTESMRARISMGSSGLHDTVGAQERDEPLLGQLLRAGIIDLFAADRFLQERGLDLPRAQGQPIRDAGEGHQLIARQVTAGHAALQLFLHLALEEEFGVLNAYAHLPYI